MGVELYNTFYTCVTYGALFIVVIEYILFKIKIKKMNERMEQLMNENEQIKKRVIDIELIDMDSVNQELRKLKEENERMEQLMNENEQIKKRVIDIELIDSVNQELRKLKEENEDTRMNIKQLETIVERFKEQQEKLDNYVYSLRKYITLTEHSDARSYIPYPTKKPYETQVSNEIHHKYNSDLSRHTFFIKEEKKNLFKHEIELYEFNYKIPE